MKCQFWGKVRQNKSGENRGPAAQQENQQQQVTGYGKLVGQANTNTTYSNSLGKNGKKMMN